ncbi:MAG: hypothetical protein E4G90_00670 [Gemmatimonadales bacterium]|nr:MAG: hypothetical protein E4G90_00670 [Gemmatimonadales bacterium]
MSIQRRWQVRRPDLLRDGWFVFPIAGEAPAGMKMFRILQPNSVVFDEYSAENDTQVWDRLLREIDPEPRA